MSSSQDLPRPLALQPDSPVRRRSNDSRQRTNRLFLWGCIVTSFVSVLLLVVLLGAIIVQGIPRLNLAFLFSPPSPKVDEAGIYPALMGTFWVCLGCGLVTLPVGVATAIFLEEFKPWGRVTRAFHSFVQINISNLAGVPSVVYGIIGVTAFVHMFHLFGTPNEPYWESGVAYYDQFLSEGDQVLLVPVETRETPMTEVREGMRAELTDGTPVEVHVIPARGRLPDDEQLLARTLRADAEAGRISNKGLSYLRLPLGRGVLAGSLTLMLVILPIVIIASQESLRAVPDSLREGSMGMGATRWQTVRNVTLPSAMPGILTGSILAMSRAIGEAAPVLIIAGIVYITYPPNHLMDDFSVMPLQIYNWAKRPQAEFHDLAASGILVLLGMLFVFNAAAVFIRHRLQKPNS